MSKSARLDSSTTAVDPASIFTSVVFCHEAALPDAIAAFIFNCFFLVSLSVVKLVFILITVCMSVGLTWSLRMFRTRSFAVP